MIPAAYRLLSVGWPYLLALGVLAGAYGVGRHHGADKVQARFDEYVQEQIDAVETERQRGLAATATLREAAIKLESDKNDEIRTINATHAAAIVRLQNRPDRRPNVPDVAAACQGANGADLSRPDGSFLVGEAARADTLRAALIQCYAQYDAVSQ